MTDVEKADCLNKLRILLKDYGKFKKLQTEDAHLKIFLYGTEFDVDAAFDKVKNYYELVLQYPDWFPILGPLDKKSVIDKKIRTILPQYDKEGRVIFIEKLSKTISTDFQKNVDVNTMTFMDIVEMDDIFFESVLLNNPRMAQKGLCIIMDGADYPLKMLQWLTPERIKLSVKKIMALPFKDYRFHMVNTSVVVHIAKKIVWPFLPEYVKEMVKFHFNDCSSLYEYIDKDVLPPEYGGTYDINYDELCEQLYQKNEEILGFTKFRRDAAFS